MIRINHRTINPYQTKKKSDILWNLDDTPYLTWVPEDLRAQTIDSTTLAPYAGPRRKILMMSSSYLTGGAEIMAVNTARILAPYHDVFLWSQRPGEYTITGNLKVYTGDPVLLAKALRVDLVIYNNGAAFWYSERFKAEYPKVKTVMCLHGLVQWTVDQFHGLEGQVRSVDAFWAFSRVCGAMKSFGFNAPAYELHCPIDATQHPYKPRCWRTPYHIGYVGRVSPEKNLVGLLRLWGKLYDKLKGKVIFHFVGGLDPTNNDQQYLDWLTPVINAAKATPEWGMLKSNGALIDHGHCNPTQVHEVVDKMHLMTLASDFEGEPVVFLEAMASGCLCSFRDVGEVGQLLIGTGLLTKADYRHMDEAEMDRMVDGIVDQLHHPARCQSMALAARKRIEKRHANDVWADNFARMMGDILK